MRLLSICIMLRLTVVVMADPPCHVRRVVVPQKTFPHAIHAATIFHDTHLGVVEVPVPAFFFQYMPAYQQPAPVQQVVASPQVAEGIGTDDMLSALLGGSLSPNPSPLTDPLTEIRQKCASCHSLDKGATKGGLALFDQGGTFTPTTSKATGLTRALIAARARSAGDDVMPPTAAKDASKRLSEAAVAYLEGK